MFFVLALALLALTLVAACIDGRDARPSTEPAASMSPSATAASTASARPAASSARTPQPTTAPPTSGFIFCESRQGDLSGFVRNPDTDPARCEAGGFVLDSLPPNAAGLTVGDFVPRCYQPVEGEGEGLTVIVGQLCVKDGPQATFTIDPRPVEVQDSIEDGDLIPFCAFDLADYPHFPITVGPPCVFGGEGYTSITVDPAVIEGAADCTAGFTYFFRSERYFRDLLMALPADGSTSLNEYRDAIHSVSAALARPAPERVERFFEPWGDRSPIEMNAGVAEAITALDDDSSAEAVQALRAQLQDGINWYSAGRGC